jgi:hypothetical protein
MAVVEVVFGIHRFPRADIHTLFVANTVSGLDWELK